jgi:hypothetical protein
VIAACVSTEDDITFAVSGTVTGFITPRGR